MKKNLFFILFFVMSCQPQIDLDEEDKLSSRSNLSELGSKAGGMDSAALASAYGITTSVAPAALRLDPDLYARRLLRQYRAEGLTLARAVGNLEDYRELLGGASQDFRVVPQEVYDATSLLALQKVTEDVCVSLVNPTWTQQQQGWKTILPQAATEVNANIRFLAQRIMGVPSSYISEAVITTLIAEVNRTRKGAATYADYVPSCVMLTVDAEALLL